MLSHACLKLCPIILPTALMAKNLVVGLSAFNSGFSQNKPLFRV